MAKEMCLLVALALASTASALKCYQCTDCGNSIGRAVECDSRYDTCMKLDVDGEVSRTCAPSTVCVAATAEQGVVGAWNSVKNFFSGLGVEVPQDVQSRAVSCCDDDYCNAGTSAMISPVLMVVPLIAYLLRC